MKNILAIIALFVTGFLFSQTPMHLKGKETSIMSFKTTDGKFVTLAMDKDKTYIVYRIGTKDKVEFEYPKDKTESLMKFKYAYFLRGGGAENEGMDINHLYFEDEQNKYVLFDTYYASTDSHRIGVTVTSISNPDDVKNIKGVLKTEQGNLTDFRTNKMISVTEEY